MIKVYQTKYIEVDGYGDCCAAAFASLLEMKEILDMPNLDSRNKNQALSIVNLMESIGYDFYGIVSPEKIYTNGINGLYVASGISPRNPKERHAVVIDKNFNIVHDPHPSNQKIEKITSVYDFAPKEKK